VVHDSLREALSLTVQARSALIADDLDAYFDFLERREPLLDIPDGAIADRDTVRGLATQILTLDRECAGLMERIERRLSDEIAEVRRAQQSQRAYASSVTAPNERGSVVQLQG
jgi:hypothetical protein